MPPSPTRLQDYDSSFSALPTELLVSIFHQCPDLSTLWSLLHTSSRLWRTFNTRTSEVVNSVIGSTVPVQTRGLMTQVLALQTNSSPLASYAEARVCGKGFKWYRPTNTPTVAATSDQLRRFVSLAHHVHILAHLCIEDCIRNCLACSLSKNKGQRNFPLDFKTPTWIEEQRALLCFWRVLFLSELKRARHDGELDHWSVEDLRSLELTSVTTHLSSGLGLNADLARVSSHRLQVLTAYWFAWTWTNRGYPEEEFWKKGALREALELPPLPEGMKFGCKWACRDHPGCCGDVEQGWERDLEMELELGRNQNRSQQSYMDQRAPSPLVVIGSESDADSSLSDIESSSTDEAHSEQEESLSSDSDSDSDSSGNSYSSRRSSGENYGNDTTRFPLPTSLPNDLNHILNPLPLKPVQRDPSPYQDLNASSTIQIWRQVHREQESSSSSPTSMSFEVYVKYGFVLWEEGRMVKLGLWPSNAVERRIDPGSIWGRGVASSRTTKSS
ncbi:hypothetical protein BJX63DRAFT_435023 [Aspergillus granulosus]|uniref:F-box domain-containing protein n=1 Tax=Aspergillus granulosus TaxID=176169 RepID=A0ABR4H2G4_9EURO